MTVIISSDHGGFALKEQIEFAYDVKSDQQGTVPRDAELINIIDLGPHEVVPQDDYPDFAFKLAEELRTRPGFLSTPGDDVGFIDETIGILVCRSGNGMAIAANKVQYVRAALCFSAEHAIKAREHNFANVLVLDADYNSLEESLSIVDAFLHARPQAGGRHERRVHKILSWEKS